MQATTDNTDSSKVWLELLDSIALDADVRVISASLFLLEAITAQTADHGPVRPRASSVAHKLLQSFVAARTDGEQGLRALANFRGGLGPALLQVLETAGKNGVCTFELLVRALDVFEPNIDGYFTLSQIALKIPRASRNIPEFAEYFYQFVFGIAYPTIPPTPLDQKAPLSQEFRDRQDLDGARRALAEVFRPFWQTAPDHAFRSLVSAIEAARSRDLKPAEIRKFALWNSVVVVVADGSYWWNSPSAFERHDGDLKLLDEFAKTVSADASNWHSTRAVLSRNTKRPWPASILASLIQSGTEHPATIGRSLIELLADTAAYRMLDIRSGLLSLLSVVHPVLDESERRFVEESLLGLQSEVPVGTGRSDDELLRCVAVLKIENVVTPTLRQLAEFSEIDPETALQPELRVSRLQAVDGREYSELVEAGVRVEASDVAETLRICEKLEENGKLIKTGRPTPELVAELHNDLLQLEKAETQLASPVEKLMYHIVGCKATTAARIASCGAKLITSEQRVTLRRILFEAARSRWPEPHVEDEKSFASSPHWGVPAPRVDAADGLTSLVTRSAEIESEIVSALRRLRCDPVPAVRFHVAGGFQTFGYWDIEIVKEFADYFARSESNPTVMSNWVRALSYFAEHEWARDLLIAARSRFPLSNSDHHTVRKFIVDVAADQYYWVGSPGYSETIEEIATSVRAAGSEQVEQIELVLRAAKPLIHRLGADKRDDDDSARDVRSRARATLSLLAISANEAYSMDTTPADTKSGLLRLLETMSGIVTQASGDSGVVPGWGGEPEREATAGYKSAFWAANSQLVLKLTEFPSSRGLSDLTQFFTAFRQIDSKNILLACSKLISGARVTQAAQQVWGVRDVVTFVEITLAEQSALIQGDVECAEAILNILDTYVDWPPAQSVAFEFERVFR